VEPITAPDNEDHIVNLGELDLDDAAQQAAGNWQSFQCFVWFRDRDLSDAENWAVIYTHNRDSGLLDQSNAAVIEKAMKPFTEGDEPDVAFESHSHWAVGHVDGFSVRVFKNGDITEAFKAYHELAQRLADYPILDEANYSEREFEATLDNIKDAAWRVKHDFDLPGDWVSEVYSWFADNLWGEIENREDQGGCPSESALLEAFDALKFKQVATA
jgi:hypothetical protein